MKGKKKILLTFFAMLLMVFAGIGSTAFVYAGAEDSVVVTAVDYDNQTLTVQGNGDTGFYFSDGKQKKWEKMVGTSNGNAMTMDISWIAVGKDYTLSLKGNVSKKPVTITIPKYNSGFKAKYDKATREVSYAGIASDYAGDIQWRVKGTSEWNTTSLSDTSLKEKLEFYINEVSSTVVYFRTAPVSVTGTPVASAGTRPSKESSITLAKKSAAPTVTVDGSTFTAKTVDGVSYRLIGSTGWTEVTDKKIDLTAAVPNLFCSGSSSASDQVVEFRKAATAKTQVSASRFLYLKAQQSKEAVGLSSASDKLTISYLSPTKVKITIALEEAQKGNTYEYAILPAGTDTVEKWTPLTVKTETVDENKNYSITCTFTSSQLENTSELRIRRKTSGKSGADNFMLASEALSLKGFTYPGDSTLVQNELAITGIRGTEYASELTSLFSYTVADTVDGDVGVASINLYKEKADDAAAVTELPAAHYELVAPTDASVNKSYRVDVKATGITALLADNKLSADTQYYFGLVLKNGEKIFTNVSLTVLPGTQVTGEKEFVKVKGYDKAASITLDYGTKNPSEYSVNVYCDQTALTIPDANITTQESSGKYTQTISFDLQDAYFPVGKGTVAISVKIRKNNSDLAEEITGIKATLKEPVSSSNSGSISFSKGNCSKDIVLTLTLLDDPQVKADFGITNVTWGNSSLREKFMAEQETDSSVTVTISQDALNKLTKGSNHVVLEINGKVNYQTNYKISVLEDAASTASSANAARGTAMRLMSSSPAAGSSPKILVNSIDYAKNELTLDLNGNTQALFSTNKKTWYGIGDKKDGNNYIFNTSWVSDTKNYTVYFKDVYATSADDYTQVVFPKKNTALKITFDKKSNADAPSLNIINAGGTTLQWRKNANCSWKNVAISGDGQLVISELEGLRVKGGKIVTRIAATDGNASSPGVRYSKEVKITIPKRAAAPATKINVSKMTVNTTTAMEYYDTAKNAWTACTKNMSVWDFDEVKSNIAANASGSEVTMQFRKAVSKSAGYSKTAEVVFCKQRQAPTISAADGSNVVYSKAEKKVKKKMVTYQYLKFNNASTTEKYQYTIVPSGTTFSEKTAKWTTVTKVKTVTLSAKKAVPGAKIYVRVLGTAAKAGNPAVLSSATGVFEITEG